MLAIARRVPLGQRHCVPVTVRTAGSALLGGMGRGRGRWEVMGRECTAGFCHSCRTRVWGCSGGGCPAREGPWPSLHGSHTDCLAHCCQCWWWRHCCANYVRRAFVGPRVRGGWQKKTAPRLIRLHSSRSTSGPESHARTQARTHPWADLAHWHGGTTTRASSGSPGWPAAAPTYPGMHIAHRYAGAARLAQPQGQRALRQDLEAVAVPESADLAVKSLAARGMKAWICGEIFSGRENRKNLGT